ncbi:MAG TPA: formate/nitrite transporter family protein [Syntrophomonadaceae bacterium]|nr:formate/nitrite transporter family protein [Syntrophomonadaceae bacterium]HNX28848.1 formate/nitrite transporter family protein [Syntrophomonadaceae bacterium]HPR93284.1 formate/nitrite transporter family protein [Syntrophomonadaceae bacterium]
MNFMTPAEIAASVCAAGKAKTELPIMKMIALGILAGVYIGFGANLATKIGSMEAAGTSGGQFLFGAVFSVGLMLVVIAGAELFTGNNMACFASAINGQATWGGLLYNWVVVWLANFAGSLLLVYIIYYGMFWADASAAAGISAMGAKALAIAKGKLTLSWSAAFLRAICCNWLVCLAVWMAFAAKDITGKIFGIFFPIMAFVSSGFEHSVANMFFIPMGITIAQNAPAGAAEVLKMQPDALLSIFNYGHLMTANLIPVTLGNIVGGAFFVGTFYWFVYLKK